MYKYCIAVLLSKVKNWRQRKYSVMGTGVALLGNMMCLLHDVLEESLPARPDAYLRMSCDTRKQHTCYRISVILKTYIKKSGRK